MRTKVLLISSLALLAVFAVASPSKADTANTINITSTLTAITGSATPATLTMTSGATTYTVEAALSTKIVRKFNGSSDLSEFLIGDTIQVKGVLSDKTANIINATWIKDLSVQRVGGTFNGYIVKLDCANNSFTYKPKERAEQTVYISTSTKITRGGEKATCSNLVVNEKARVIGLWRKATNQIYADRIIVNQQAMSGTITNIELTSGGLPATLTILRKNGETWTINVTSTTKLFRRYMRTSTIDEFVVGDKVEARGIVATGNVLNAKMVRDNSIMEKDHEYPSRIKSIDTSASTFVITIKEKDKKVDITVTTSSTTKYAGEEHATITFTDLTVNAKVEVLGVYNSTTKTLAASRIIIDD